MGFSFGELCLFFRRIYVGYLLHQIGYFLPILIRKLFQRGRRPVYGFLQGGLLKQLSKRLVEKALQSEMDTHLGYSKYDCNHSENTRNGLSSKQVLTDKGVIQVEVPRDRSSSFKPILLPKRQTRIPGLDDKILSLYAKGMSLYDIQIQIQYLYGAEVSERLISNITEAVIEDVQIWQNRPLEAVYAIVFFDCFVVKVRQDKRIFKDL